MFIGHFNFIRFPPSQSCLSICLSIICVWLFPFLSLTCGSCTSVLDISPLSSSGLPFKKLTIFLVCKLHSIKFTLLKYALQWFLVFSQSWAAITTIKFQKTVGFTYSFSVAHIHGKRRDQEGGIDVALTPPNFPCSRKDN